MPGPLMQKPTFSDFGLDAIDPKQASVFDAPGQGVLRKIVGLLGLDDPNQIMSASVNPVAMTLAPRVPAEQLLEQLAPLRKVAPEIRNAVDHLIQRFPRLMSHISRINPSPLATPEQQTIGRMVPEFLAKMPQFAADAPEGQAMRGPLAMIQYDPTAIKGRELETMAHEVAHVAQTVRATDVARRIPGQPSFPELYQRMSAAQGYYNNPMEVGAREASASVVAKKPIFEPRNVASRIWDAVGGDSVAVENRLRQVFPDISNVQVMDAIRYARPDK